MSSHIQNLVQNVLGDGARSSKYDVMLQFTNPDPANFRSRFIKN